MDKDVTAHVKIGENDGEFLELSECVCGRKWDDRWESFIGIYQDMASDCPHCGRKLYFTNKITVYKVIEKEGEEQCHEETKQGPQEVLKAQEPDKAEAKAEPQEGEPEAKQVDGRVLVNER